MRSKGQQREGAWLCLTGEGEEGGRLLSEASDRPGGLLRHVP